MTRVPPLSVVMPVRNAGVHLDRSVSDILGQSFGDFELVLLDDASTDDSAERLARWGERDPRIRLFRADSRLGPAGSSNFVMAKARAPLIARMDADDSAHPDRLRRQVAALDAAPDAVLVGAVGDVIAASGKRLRGADFAALHAASRLPPFAHSSIIVRREAFEAVGGYRASADGWEDIDLVLRLSELGRILVLTEPLMRIRISGASSRIRTDRDRLEARMDLLWRCLAEHEAGRSYQAQLVRGPRPEERVDPQAFVLAHSPALWAGRTGGLFRRLIRRASLGVEGESARAIAWAAFADVAPGTLRSILDAKRRVHGVAARRRIGPVVEWQPRRRSA